MKLNSLQTLGLVLMASALLLFVFTTGSIVEYSTVAPNATFTPGNTTPTSPFVEPANTVYKCEAILAGIQQSEVSTINVQISLWSGSAWTTVGTYPLTYISSVSSALWYGYNFQLGGTGNLYALSYLVQTTDVGSFTGLCYVETQASPGFFSINGISATTTSVIRVTNPTLTLTYTVNASYVSYSGFTVYVTILNESNNAQLNQITLTAPQNGQTPANFAGSYTLPAPGTYIMNGYVTYQGSTSQEMAILGQFGDIGNGNSIPLADFYIVIGFFGLVFFVIGSLTKKPAKER